ncbi:MAG: hypothetical protein GX112_01375 [Clostridiaceae bacterium]|nr:hypothetical protein [Clostridiaceae bacterium]
MTASQQMPHRHQPLPLLRNVIYPSYQLLAETGRADPAAALVCAVLETFSWLRKRFCQFGIPPELDWPEPDAAETVSLNRFHSFRLDTGYSLDVIWLSREQIWAMQLTEPDLGPNPGAKNQDRPPVAGRLFETHVAFRLLNGRVICGFRTLVSEPQGTTAPCEVYRLALVGQLVRNPRLGLEHGWPIRYEPITLDRAVVLHNLKAWLKHPDRMLPAVIVAEALPELPGPEQLPTPDELIARLSRLPASGILPPPIIPDPEPPAALDLDRLAHDKMGYGQFFFVPAAQQAAFQKTCGYALYPGEALVVEPLAFGQDHMHVPYDQIRHNPAGERVRLDAWLQDYPKQKPVVFKSVVFLPEAKAIERKQVLDIHHSKEEILRAGEEREQALLLRHTDDMRRLQAMFDLKETKIKKLTEQIKSQAEDAAALRQEKEELEQHYLAELGKKDARIQRLETLADRPACLDELPDWVRRFFAGKLLLHTRALRELTDVAPDEVNLPLLCDALEFLACEYRDLLLGVIGEDDEHLLCAQKYGRGFDVAPVKGVSVDMYPTDYKIKYYAGHKGKPVESLLDRHLRIGDKTGHLLRIYFLYDKDKRLIVVGSLPRHLRTVSYE